MSLADRIAGLNPSAGPNNSSNGSSGRAPTGRAPSRNKQQSRPAPYVKSPPPTPAIQAAAPPAKLTNAQARVAGNIDGKWERDLFNPLSDLYNPQVNSNNPALARSTSRTGSGSGVFGKAVGSIAQPSASLRPFGVSSTPTSRVVSPVQQTISSSNGAKQEQYASNDLFGRFGVNEITVEGGRTGGGVNLQQAQQQQQSNIVGDERKARQRQIAIAEEEARLKAAERKASRQRELDLIAAREAEERRVRQIALEQEALDREMSRQQEEELELERQRKLANSTLVVVKNLVDGTTPEDVKAAFADFGDIGECKVLESNGDTLVMQVEFMERKDAVVAVQKLDGALADGRTLRLTIQERPKPPPPAPRGITLKGSQNRQANGQTLPSLAARGNSNGMGNVPTGPRSQQQRAQPQAAMQQQQRLPPQAVQEVEMSIQTEIPQVQSRMRSDQLATLDPRTTTMTTPAQQQFARRAPVQQPQQQQQRSAPNQPSNNIAARFGISPNSNAQQQRGFSWNTNGARQGGSGNAAGGLLARLGGASSGRNTGGGDAMDLS